MLGEFAWLGSCGGDTSALQESEARGMGREFPSVHRSSTNSGSFSAGSGTISLRAHGLGSGKRLLRVTSLGKSVTDPDWGEVAGKTCKELEISVSQTLVPMRSFDLPDICRECSMTGHKKSRRMSGDNCHIPGIQGQDEKAKDDTNLGQLLTKQERN